MPSDEWPFADPRNVAVLTTRSIVELGAPILRVSHDEEDGMWQFHSGEGVSPDQAMVVSLGQIAALDPSVFELADLPLGFIADRNSNVGRWVRSEAA
jgi:hypothetical protein